MKKIAYIEIDTHAEIAGNFRELMLDSRKFSVDFYFSDKILKLLNLPLSENIFKVSEKTLVQSLKGKDYDLVIIGTVHRYFNVFKKVTNLFSTAVIGHNLNFIEASTFTLLSNITKKDFKFRLKLLLKEGLLRKNKVYKNAKKIFVLDEKMTMGNYQFLPIFFSQFSEKSSEDKVKIVIPGAVSQKRRNYKSVINKIKHWKNPQFSEFIFLGKASGKELTWLRELEQNKPQNIDIKYFTNKVSQSIFDKLMQNTTLLWCPIQEETEFFSIKEFYGTTKISGNIGDAIKYSKPAVFPESYLGQYPFVLSDNQSFVLDENFDITKIFEPYKKENILIKLEETLLGLV